MEGNWSGIISFRKLISKLGTTWTLEIGEKDAIRGKLTLTPNSAAEVFYDLGQVIAHL